MAPAFTSSDTITVMKDVGYTQWWLELLWAAADRYRGGKLADRVVLWRMLEENCQWDVRRAMKEAQAQYCP